MCVRVCIAHFLFNAIQWAGNGVAVLRCTRVYAMCIVRYTVSTYYKWVSYVCSCVCEKMPATENYIVSLISSNKIYCINNNVIQTKMEYFIWTQRQWMQRTSNERSKHFMGWISEQTTERKQKNGRKKE